MKISPIFEELTSDTYSSYNGMQPYAERKKQFFNGIKTFTDITDDMIPTIIDYLGYEGYNDSEEAIAELTDKIHEYQNYSDPVKLYRIVGVTNKKMIRTKDMGEHFTPYKWNLDGDMLNSIGHDNWDSNTTPYVIEAAVPLSEIDVLQTLIQNLSFPNEHEINLKNKGIGAKIIKTYKLFK